MPEADVADHAFLGGRLVLREPCHGHRSGTDAVLLAAAAGLRPGQHLVDVGAGAGAAALAALCHCADATATLIERDPWMAALAQHNVTANGFGERARIVRADIFDDAVVREAGVVPGDVVISNPPFYLAGTVRASPNLQQADSHVLAGRDHGDWCRRALALTAARGRTILIHRPDALADIVSAMHGKAGIGLRTIHPRQNAGASRIIVTGAKGRKSPLSILSPLVLHHENGAFTPEADALHRGQATLSNEKGRRNAGPVEDQ